MAEESAKLRIPYIAAAQAQKHVTHNEGMTLLDTLVQLSVLDKDLTAPPGSPAEGDCYIVAGAGGTATGAWVGWEKRIARFIDGEWRSYLPGQGGGAGWLAWVLDEDAMYRFDGAAWALAGIEGPQGPQGPPGQSFQPDAVVALIAGRDAYDGEAAAFSVLVVSDSSNGDQPTLYFKLSAANADWSDSITWASEGGGSANGGGATVRAATTGNITIATALNNGDTIDGVTLADGDLVLVKDQSSAAQNGIYVAGTTPARDESFAAFDQHPGVFVAVQEGAVNHDTTWLCTSDRGGTIDSSALVFADRTPALQTLSTTYDTNTSLTATIPFDDTIPQDDEGTQVLSLSITPKSASNRLVIRGDGWGACNSSAGAIYAVFTSVSSNAIKAGPFYATLLTNNFQGFSFEVVVVAGTTSPLTISVRVGPASAGTLRLNGNVAGRLLGGSGKASLVVQELRP